MDTSKEYINMCEKAAQQSDIRKDYEKLSLSLTQRRYDDMTKVKKDFNDEGFFLFNQDQLQEMIRKAKDDLGYIADFYHFWVNGELDKYFITKPSSVESVWLRYVMAEKYKKVWNGKNWIKEKK